VLDGLLYHESDLEIREHYTDTAGFTDHVFALMHLLGFAFCPRIRDLHDKKLFIKGKADQYPALQSLISTTSLNLKEIEIHWRETSSGHFNKAGNRDGIPDVEKACQLPQTKRTCQSTEEIGRLERTLFMLDWFRDPALRRRVQAGLNKGEARNALARAVFLHRLGEIRDRKPENQSYRASGLTLLTAAISCGIPSIWKERSMP
jgi:TnpA family transposase